MKKVACYIFLTAFCFTAMTACKKKKDKSRAELLVGKWKTTYSVIDSNNNKFKDADEYHPVSDSIGVVMVFNADGTHIVSSVLNPAANTPGKWQLANGDKDLLLIRTKSYGLDTLILHFESVDADKFIFVYDNYFTPGNWTLWAVFTKQ